MATTKDKIAIALATAGLLSGAMTFLQPPKSDPHERARQQIQDRISDLGDAHDQEVNRIRKAGDDLGEAVQADRNRPGEHRAPEPKVRIKVIP